MRKRDEHVPEESQKRRCFSRQRFCFPERAWIMRQEGVHRLRRGQKGTSLGPPKAENRNALFLRLGSLLTYWSGLGGPIYSLPTIFEAFLFSHEQKASICPALSAESLVVLVQWPSRPQTSPFPFSLWAHFSKPGLPQTKTDEALASFRSRFACT